MEYVSPTSNSEVNHSEPLWTPPVVEKQQSQTTAPVAKEALTQNLATTFDDDDWEEF